MFQNWRWLLLTLQCLFGDKKFEQTRQDNLVAKPLDSIRSIL